MVAFLIYSCYFCERNQTIEYIYQSHIMRKVLTILCLLLTYQCIQAQYSDRNSMMRKELVSYHRNGLGYYEVVTNRMVREVNDIVENYAYDKSTNCLYVLTNNSNVAIVLEKEFAKYIRKSKDIPHLSGSALTQAIDKRNRQLADKYYMLNQRRGQEIADSTAKAQQDSLDEVLRRQMAEIDEANQREQYRRTHSAHRVDLSNYSLSCSICDELIDGLNVTEVIGIKNDSIYFFTEEEGDLGLEYKVPHQAEITEGMREDSAFMYHWKAFQRELAMNEQKGVNAMADFADRYASYITRLREIAPYGYVKDWDWDDKDGKITMSLSFVNTRKSTIRYIHFHFVVLNDVGDVCSQGVFRATGPVEEFESGSWEWNNSYYYTYGDATTMKFTKIVITYMNGTQKVLMGGNVVIDD